MTATVESYITVNQFGNTSGYVGPDATNLFRVMCLTNALGIYHKTGMIPTRGMTASKMLAFAGQVTQKRYKRGEIVSAIEDLRMWCVNMKSALPEVQERPLPGHAPTSREQGQ